MDLFERKWLVPIVLFGITLATHGFLLVSDFVIADDWWLLDWLKAKDWDSIKHLTHANGLYLQRYFLAFYLLFPEPVVVTKLATLIELYAISIAIFSILKATNFFSNIESLFISVVGITLPVVRVYGNTMPMMMYISMYLLFLICVLMAFKTEKGVGYGHWPLRLITLGGFFVSFTFGSLLVFYFGFLAGLMYFRFKETEGDRVFIAWRWITTRLDYCCLPFVFWFWRRIFHPGIESGIDYQVPAFESLTRLPAAFIRLVVGVIPEQVFGGISLLFSVPIGGVVTLLFSYMLTRIAYTYFRDRESSDHRDIKIYRLVVFAGLLLFFAVFPYWATNYPIESDGFNSRHALLMSVPIAMLLLACFKLLHKTFQGSVSQFGMLFLFIFMIMSFAAVQITTYYEWQAISVKEKSVVENMKQLASLDDYRLVKVEDQFILNYLYEEWSRWPYALKIVIGDDERYAFGSYKYSNAYIYPDKELVIDLVMGNISDPPFRSLEAKRKILEGKQGILSIQPGKFFKEYIALSDTHNLQPTGEFIMGKRQKVRLVTQYLYYKYFRRKRMNTFLKDITIVKIRPTDDLFS